MKTNKIRLTGLIFLLALFTIMNLSCGGDGSSSSGKTTAISVNLTAAKSSDIAKLKFTISAPDMGTIERTVDVAVTQISGDLIVVNFDVPNGLNRHVVIESLDASGSVIFIGDSSVDLDGTAKSIEIILLPFTPPTINLSGNWNLFNTPQGGTEQGPVIRIISQAGNSFTISGIGPDPKTGQGVITGNSISMTFTEQGTAQNCGNTVTGTLIGTISADGNSVSGTYTSTGGCATGTETGTWRMVRVLTPAPTPPSLPSGFPSDVPTGNYIISVSVCVEGTCADGQSFTMSNTDINQFAQSMLDALNTTSAQQQASCSQAGVTCSFNVVYTPWDGASFTITDNISVTDCTSGTCTTASAQVKFTITKTAGP